MDIASQETETKILKDFDLQRLIKLQYESLMHTQKFSRQVLFGLGQNLLLRSQDLRELYRNC